MKRVALAIVSTVTGLVLLVSFKTHAAGHSSGPVAAVSMPNTTSSSATKTTTKKSVTKRKPTPSTTVTGAAADTMYGPVQVKVTVKNGKVTSVAAVEYPNNDPRDAQINAYAIPVLNSEAARAGSANITHVSGATYTSDGYVASLQSALSKAGL